MEPLHSALRNAIQKSYVRVAVAATALAKPRLVPAARRAYLKIFGIDRARDFRAAERPELMRGP